MSGAWAAGTLGVLLGVGSCVTLYRAVDRPRPRRVLLAAVLLVAHCGWAMYVVLVLAPNR